MFLHVCPNALFKSKENVIVRDRTSKYRRVSSGRADCTEDSWYQWLLVEISSELYFISFWNVVNINR